MTQITSRIFLVIAHNRWWCNETDYGSRQGGGYEFLYDDASGTAVPQGLKRFSNFIKFNTKHLYFKYSDPAFWEDLFKNSSAWGLKVYLQDWLDVETNSLPLFEEDLTVERNWLTQMGQGAARNDINILYCMSYSRHMMQETVSLMCIFQFLLIL